MTTVRTAISICLLLCATGIANAGTVLIYGPSLKSQSINEQTLAVSAGHTVTVAGATAWSAMTTAQFASYDAIVFGDGGCADSWTSNVADANKGVWTPAIKGNSVMMALDPAAHSVDDLFSGSARLLFTDAIGFATSGNGTGLYVSFGCGTSPQFLSQLGNFQTVPVYGNQVNVTDQSHPVVRNVSGPALSNWEYSVHQYITSYPSNYSVVATDGQGGAVMIATAAWGYSIYQYIASSPSNDPVVETDDQEGAVMIATAGGLSVSDVTVLEGDKKTVSAIFSITRTGDTSSTSTVDYTTSQGTADSEDYESTQGTLSFGPAETEKTISVLIMGDLDGEGPEQFTVELSDAMGAEITDPDGTGLIVDNEPVISIDSIEVSEGPSRFTLAAFTVSLSAPSPHGVTVDFTTLNETSQFPADYEAATGTLTFGPEERTLSVTLSILDDKLAEVSETFVMLLRNATHAFIANDKGQATILDNDVAGVTLPPISVLTSSEENQAAKLFVALGSQPDSSVSLGVAATGMTEGTHP